jgi:hypothetical protein
MGLQQPDAAHGGVYAWEQIMLFRKIVLSKMPKKRGLPKGDSLFTFKTKPLQIFEIYALGFICHLVV